MSTTGITRKLVRVFVLQMIFISVITALGVYVAATIVERVMIRTALEDEATHFWTQRAQNPQHPVPNTDNLLGYLADSGDFSHVPAILHEVQPGFGRVKFSEQNEPIVYVEDKGTQRLFLIFDEKSVGKLSFYFGVVPLSLVLMVMYVSAWLAYRSSQRTLSPMVSLAKTMRGFDLSRDNLDSLHLDDYTVAGIDDEVFVLAESLKEFTNRLKRQLQREQEFTRDVSHELRTPLAVIRGSLQILEKQPLTTTQRRAVKRMSTTSRDMLSLIETLLLLARDGDDAQNKHENIVVNDLVRLLVEQIEATHNKDRHVEIVTEDLALLNAAAPRQAIGIVIGNLLRNACNYTRNGTVLISTDRHTVTIRDTGNGIAEHDLQRVQQAFQRSSDQTEGYGLGLDIVRRLCERYHWTLEISSVPEQGTAVSVRFRL
ncbi:MAG: HAMP domain-containing sensor histidine kinase [Thiolinea sp.]